MRSDRRDFLRVLSLSAAALYGRQSFALAADQWFPITDDQGRPVANLRLPVELTSEIEELRGVFFVGAVARDLTVIEFYDYNCPYCRKAAKDLRDLAGSVPGLRLGLVNNPILSPMSAHAAKVELALLALTGPPVAYEFHGALFDRRGPIDGPKALETASKFGVARDRVEGLANSQEIADALSAQMRLAASLGFAATPSFEIAGAGLLGYPGPKSLRRIIGAIQRCDQVAC